MTYRKKTYILPQELINEMKSIFESKTETDAIVSAMKEISLKKKLLQWHDKNKGRWRLKKLYA